MAGKHLSEDQIKYVITADSSRAQQELHKLSKSTAELRKEEKARRSAMIELEATGQKNSQQYRRLKEECKEYTKQISDNEKKMKEMRTALDVNAMTMNQLKKYSKDLRRELDNMSKSLNPDAYSELESRLKAVNLRMEDLKTGARGLKEIFTNTTSLSVMAGNVLTKLGEFVGSGLRKMTDSIADTINQSIELAESADGITHAFNQLNRPDLLDGLRKATKNTVTDIELMKAAVKARDFRIPLEDLGKYLSFAQLKAQQTGQSLDYMVDSIVTGLGRQSPQILDNLGLSAAEIKEETKNTGDFMKAVATIVEKNLAAAGETYISAADRAAQRTTALENAQKSLGDALLPVKEQFADSYGQIQISIINVIKYLVQHRDTLLVIGKGVTVLTATYLAYVTALKLSHLWGLRTVAVSKLKAAAVAVENAMLELAALRQAVLNKTITTSIALQKAFNVVLKLSPWGIVLGGITLVVSALLLFSKRTDAAAKSQKMLNDIKKEAVSRTVEQRQQINLLIAAAKDEKLSMQQRQKAVNELNRIIPHYNAQLDATTGKYRENKKALDNYLNSLVRKYEIEGAKDMLAKLGKEAFETKMELIEANKALNNAKKAGSGYSYTTSWGAVGNTQQDLTNKQQGKIKAAQVKLNDINKQRQAIFNVYGKDLVEDAIANTQNTTPVKTVGTELDRIKNKIEELKKQRLTIKVGDTAGLKKIDAQIAALEKRKASLEYKNSSAKSGSDKAGQQAKSAFDNARRQELDTEKASYNESMNQLRQQLATKQKTREEYDNSALLLEIAHATKVLAIEEDYTQKSKNLVLKDKNEKARIVLAQQANEQQAKQAYQDKALAAQQKFYDTMKQLEQQGMTAQQRQKFDHDLQLSALEANYKASLEYARKHGEDEKALTEAYAKAKLQIEMDWAKKTEEQKAQVRQQYGLVTFEEQLAAEKRRRKESFDNGLLNEEKYNQAISNLEQDAEEHKLQIRQQYGIATQQELYDAEMAQLKQHLDNRVLTQEQYEEAVKQMKIAKWKESFDYYSNLFGTAIKELQNAEMANVDAKYDAEIQAAQGNAEQVEKLEKQKANEKLKIQKKYADVNFAIQASQIIVNTAVSVMRAFSELGPIAGAIAGAMMSVAGTAQLAVANAERQKVKKMTLQGTSSSSSSTSGTRVATGLEEGGNIDVEREQDGKHFRAEYAPAKRGYVDHPTVIVGEGPVGRSKEWVASNAALENPTVAPLIDIIDRAQRVGDIRTLDMRKLLLSQQKGFAAGGHISASPAQSVTPSTPTTAASSQIPVYELIALLRDLRDKGVPAYVGLDEFDAKQQIRNQSRNIARK